MRYCLFLPIFLFIVSSSCNNTKPENDTPISGSINLSVDETLRPIAEAQVDVYVHTYPGAKINVHYRPENDCVQDLLKDSCQVIFLGRALTTQEKDAFKTLKFDPPSLKIATDAIALVLNKSDKDTIMTMDKIARIFKGEVTDKTIVFDNAQSGTVNYIINKFGLDKMPKKVFAAKSNLDAVKYVSETPNTIGVIGWCWISDSDDPITNKILSAVNLVNLVSLDSASKGEAFKPYQLNLAQNKYPLSREVYIIPRERRMGLAMGFATFVYGVIGQTIILKSGILPANQEPREIEIITKPVK